MKLIIKRELSQATKEQSQRNKSDLIYGSNLFQSTHPASRCCYVGLMRALGLQHVI